MRLPIEDDWQPQFHSVDTGGNEYEQYVQTLAQRLHETNKVAGQQFKLSHETAKQHYDRRAKLEQFKKGEFVYVHGPTHKRSKARKFSYQYRGPFEVEGRISPLIYRIRMADGTIATIHINRLKRAYKPLENMSALPLSSKLTQKTCLKKSRKVDPTEDNDEAIGKLNVEIPSYSGLRDVGSDESNGSDDEVIISSRGSVEDPEWTPGSLNL
jgi:hypothetical protein